MFLLDSLMISGIRWAIETVVTAAEAEMNDDTALREQLLEAEMRREMGEITDEQFAAIEGDLLARIREIKERREGAGPLAFGGAQPIETTADSTFQIEASVSGDFHDPAAAPHTTVVETAPVSGNILQTAGERTIEVLDMEPGSVEPPGQPALPLSSPARSRTTRPTRSGRGTRVPATSRSRKAARRSR